VGTEGEVTPGGGGRSASGRSHKEKRTGTKGQERKKKRGPRESCQERHQKRGKKREKTCQVQGRRGRLAKKKKKSNFNPNKKIPTPNLKARVKVPRLGSKKGGELKKSPRSANGGPNQREAKEAAPLNAGGGKHCQEQKKKGGKKVPKKGVKKNLPGDFL